MLALALLIASGAVVDPSDPPPVPAVVVDRKNVDVVVADPADPAAPPVEEDSDEVEAIVRIVKVNGVDGSNSKVWPLDDVVLSAAASRAEGGVAGYSWTLVRKPPGSLVTLASDGAVETSFLFPVEERRVAGLDEAGDYYVRLTVTSEHQQRSSRDFTVHVAWPGGKKLDLPKPDASASAKGSIGLGALTGCCTGGAIGIAAAALAAGVSGGAALVCVPAICPCATAGAIVGTGVGASHEDIDTLDLSPWLLGGAGIEVLGMTTVLGSTLGAIYFTGAFGGVGLPPFTGTPIDQNVFVVAAGVGFLAMLAGPPVTVLAAYATAPDGTAPVPQTTTTATAAPTTTARSDPR